MNLECVENENNRDKDREQHTVSEKRVEDVRDAPGSEPRQFQVQADLLGSFYRLVKRGSFRICQWHRHDGQTIENPLVEARYLGLTEEWYRRRESNPHALAGTGF